MDAEFGDQHSGLHLALASLESSLAPPNGIASHTGGVERKSRKARVMGHNKTSANFSPPSFHFISFHFIRVRVYNSNSGVGTDSGLYVFEIVSTHLYQGGGWSYKLQSLLETLLFSRLLRSAAPWHRCKYYIILTRRPRPQTFIIQNLPVFKILTYFIY